MLRTVLALVVVLVIGVVFLACRKPKTLQEELAGLVPSERAALEGICKDAGITVEQLRSVGRLGLPKNLLSVVFAEGHVVGLRISGTALSQMQQVAGLPELASLWLPDNKLQELAGLENAKKLSELVLSQNQLRKLTGLAGATALTELAAARNALVDLQGLSTLVNLETLEVTGNQLKTLDELATLPKLWTVRAKENPLTSAEGVRPVRTRGGSLELPEAVGAVASGVNAPRPADESPSTFVEKLPELSKKFDGLETFNAPSTGQVFEYSGRLKVLNAAAFFNLVEGKNSSSDPVTVELQVQSGKVRVYLADLKGFRYVEATPEHAARITGRLMLGLGYYMVLEAVGGEAKGMSWRVFRK